MCSGRFTDKEKQILEKQKFPNVELATLEKQLKELLELHIEYQEPTLKFTPFVILKKLLVSTHCVRLKKLLVFTLFVLLKKLLVFTLFVLLKEFLEFTLFNLLKELLESEESLKQIKELLAFMLFQKL